MQAEARWRSTHYDQKFVSPLEYPYFTLNGDRRNHQIRVHMSEAHHPIVGDLLYGGGSRAPALKIVTALKRIALHAAELGFVHPVREKYVN